MVTSLFSILWSPSCTRDGITVLGKLNANNNGEKIYNSYNFTAIVFSYNNMGNKLLLSFGAKFQRSTTWEISAIWLAQSSGILA